MTSDHDEFGGGRVSVRQTLRDFERRARWGNERVWRYVLNAPAAADFRRHPAELNDEAKRVLGVLARDGVAASHLDDLTGDPTLLTRLHELGAAMEAERAQLPPIPPELNPKPFLIELLDSHRPEVAPDSFLVETSLHPQIKGIADAYFGLRTRVNDINIWRNLPRHEAPSSSQLWHRDLRTDRVMVKAFIYLEDVTPGSGPFSYAVGTHPRGDHHEEVHGFFDGMNKRVGDEHRTELHDREAVFTGRAGTILFADMLGYHRGGFATDNSRFLMQIRYASLASTKLNLLTAPPRTRVRRAQRATLAYERRASRRRPATREY